MGKYGDLLSDPWKQQSEASSGFVSDMRDIYEDAMSSPSLADTPDLSKDDLAIAADMARRSYNVGVAAKDFELSGASDAHYGILDSEVYQDALSDNDLDKYMEPDPAISQSGPILNPEPILDGPKSGPIFKPVPDFGPKSGPIPRPIPPIEGKDGPIFEPEPPVDTPDFYDERFRKRPGSLPLAYDFATLDPPPVPPSHTVYGLIPLGVSAKDDIFVVPMADDNHNLELHDFSKPLFGVKPVLDDNDNEVTVTIDDQTYAIATVPLFENDSILSYPDGPTFMLGGEIVRRQQEVIDTPLVATIVDAADQRTSVAEPIYFANTDPKMLDNTKYSKPSFDAAFSYNTKSSETLEKNMKDGFGKPNPITDVYSELLPDDNRNYDFGNSLNSKDGFESNDPDNNNTDYGDFGD